MTRSTLTRDTQFLKAKPGDGVARFDHLNSMTAKRSPKSPAPHPIGVPQCGPLPIPLHWWDPDRPGWRMNVPGSTYTDSPPRISGAGHMGQVA